MWAVRVTPRFTHAKADTLFSPPGVGNHSESRRVGGSRVHPCEARGGEYSPGHGSPPCATHPPSIGWASPGAAGNESRLLDSKHRTESTGIFPLPRFLQSYSFSFHPCRDVARAWWHGLPAGPGLKRLRGAAVHALAPAGTVSSRPPLPGLGTPPEAGGGRAPAGQGRTPALPGEVCKHSCSRALEPLEMRP